MNLVEMLLTAAAIDLLKERNKPWSMPLSYQVMHAACHYHLARVA